MVDAAASPMTETDVSHRNADISVTFDNSVQSFVLSTAKNGHVTQCIGVANLLGADVKDVLQIRGLNKALPKWRRHLDKVNWLIPTLRMIWKFRKGRFFIISSGRSVLPACRWIKLLRGDNVFILYVGSPKTWTTNCADVMIRTQHERVPNADEDNRYPWKPKQVWIKSPICRPLPVSSDKQNGVAVLLGGLNITYGDNAEDYRDFIDNLGALVAAHPVSIVFSRRTKPEVKNAIEQRFKHTNARLVDAVDRQGFLDACEGAGAFVVTPDSITMVAEACATGKSVYTAKLRLKRKETRNHRFIETHLQNGYVHPFEGTVNFDRRAVDRPDVEAARGDLTGYIQAWKKALN